MIHSVINCFSIHMYVYRDFIQKNIHLCTYDQMILSFNCKMIGNNW